MAMYKIENLKMNAIFIVIKTYEKIFDIGCQQSISDLPVARIYLKVVITFID